MNQSRESRERYDAWEQYEESLELALTGHQNHEAAKSYIPSPREIKARIKALKWLQQKQFSDRLQDSIMIYDCPTIDTVQRLVKSVGLQETKQRLENFLRDE